MAHQAVEMGLIGIAGVRPAVFGTVQSSQAPKGSGIKRFRIKPPEGRGRKRFRRFELFRGRGVGRGGILGEESVSARQCGVHFETAVVP